MSPLTYLLFVLFALDLLIIAARTGLMNARQARLASLDDELGKKAGRTLDLLERRSDLGDALRLALALLRFLMAGLALDYLIPTTQGSASPINLGALLGVGLLIWLAEFFVERRVLRDPERWALRLSDVGRVVYLLTRPLLFVLNRLNRDEAAGAQLEAITEDELKSFVDASERQGVLERDERQMIFSIFKFGDTFVREIMIPRIDIFGMDVETPLQEAGDAAIESGYSRIPIYKDSIDNVLGLLYVKDLLKAWRGKGDYKSLRELIRQPYFVPESKKLDELLAEMQGKRFHMGIVVDEYGGVAGLVTLEDLMEEIVGEIQDEYDLGEEQNYQKISDDQYLFHGRIPLAEFNELMHSELSTENADTLGGYLFSQLGHLPRTGERLVEDDLTLIIEQVAGRRIRRVRATRGQKQPVETQKETNA